MRKSLTILKSVLFSASIAAIAIMAHSCKEPVIEPDIKINGEASVTLDFDQAGTKSITVVSTMEWSVSNIPDWVDIVPPSGSEGTSNVLVKVEENPEGGPREASLDFKIDNSAKAVLTVKHTTEAVLKTNQDKFSLPAEGGEVKFSVSANTPWKLALKNEDDRKYIEAISAESGTGNEEISITVKNNVTVDDLSITLALSSTNSAIIPKIEQEIVISQGADAIRLEPEKEIVYAPKEGGAITFSILSNISWKLELENQEDSGYIESFSPKSGTGDTEITVVFKENNNTEPIVFGMVLSSDDARVNPAVEKKITLSQSNSTPILTVDNTSFTIPGEGGTAKFNIASNTAWEIVLSDAKQIEHIQSISKKTGEGDQEITIIFKQNPNVAITNVGMEVKTTDPSVVPTITRNLTFKHEGGEVRLEVGATELSVSGLGGSVSFSINSNIKWTVSVKNASDEKYVESITPSSDTGDAKVIVKVNENTMEDPLSFVLQVKSDDQNVSPAIEHQITIKQAAGVPPAPPGNVTVAPSFEYAELSWDEVPRATGYELEINGQSLILETTEYKSTGLLPGEWYSYRIRSIRYDLYSPWKEGGFGSRDVSPDANWLGTWNGNISTLRLKSARFGELNIWNILSTTPNPAVSMTVSGHPSISYKAVIAMSGGLTSIFPSSALSNLAVINAGTQLTESVTSTERVNMTINKLITDIPEIMSQLTGDEIKAIIGIKLQTIHFNTKSVTYSGLLLGNNQAHVTLTAKGDVTASLSGGDSSARTQLAAKIQELLRDTDYTLVIPNMAK